MPSDIGGWAGDLLSVLIAYKEGIASGNVSGSLLAYAEDTLMLFTEGVLNSFGLSDFVEDCEGFNIARAFISTPSASIPALVRQVLSTETPRDNCFLRFLRGRTSDSSATAEALGQNAVSGPVDSVFDGFRIALLLTGNPSVQLGEFTQSEREALGQLFGERWVEMARA